MRREAHVRFCERLCQEDEKSSCCTKDGGGPSSVTPRLLSFQPGHKHTRKLCWVTNRIEKNVSGVRISTFLRWVASQRDTPIDLKDIWCLGVFTQAQAKIENVLGASNQHSEIPQES